jgi:hypothetical protein
VVLLFLSRNLVVLQKQSVEYNYVSRPLNFLIEKVLVLGIIVYCED